MSELVNLAMSLSLNFGSGMILRFGTSRRRGMATSSNHELKSMTLATRSALRALDAVLRTLAVAGRLVGGAGTGRAGRVQSSTHDVITHAGEVLHAATTDEHDGVLLEIVPFARDVARDFHLVREAHATNFAQSRVRLLGRGRVDTNANATALRAGLERRRGRLVTSGFAAVSDELANGRHGESF